MFDILRSQPKVLVQGITGTHGSFHTAAMLQAGTEIIAGVTPGKGGVKIHDVPVYGSVAEAMVNHAIDISVVFVPPQFAKAALVEAIDAGVKLIVCITEGIPVHDMLVVLAAAKGRGVKLIGPNCPGILVPSQVKLGIIPTSIGMLGSVAVVSRSGTLTYEAAASLTARGIGQRYIVGIGGDRIHGLGFIDCLQAFEADEQVSHIVIIGEIGGQDEQLAADYIKENVRKPVYSYIVGHSAPPEQQLGHAGAIMGGRNESAAAKTAYLNSAGIDTAISLPELIERVAKSLE